MGRHVLVQRDKPIAETAVDRESPHAGGFDCQTQLVGKGRWTGQDGGGVSVYFEPSTGAAGEGVAKNILSRVDDLMAYCDQVFGVRGKAGNVVVCSSPFNGLTDGTGGAYHYGCAFNADAPGSDWYEDVADGNPDMVFGLVMAEVCESYMGLQKKGWNCGGSGGEGLSRYLAEIVSGGPSGALSAFSSASAWDGSDWVSRDQGTDQDYPSIGCAVLYCWWMTSQGFTPAQIVQAGEPDGTLASNYATLTGKPKEQAFADFQAAVTAVGHASDNPWGTATPTYPLPRPAPTPAPTPGPAPGPTPSPSQGLKLLIPPTRANGIVWFRTPVKLGGHYVLTPAPPSEAPPEWTEALSVEDK